MPVLQRVSLNDSNISSNISQHFVPVAPIAQVSAVASDKEEKITKAKVVVDHYSKRLRVTSKIIMVIGAIGALASIYHGFGARHAAEHMMHKHQPHNMTGPPPPREDHNAPLSRDEFALYDIIQKVCFFSLIMSITLLCMGKKSLMAIWKKKPVFTRRVYKKNIMRIGLLVLSGAATHHFVKEAKHIVHHNEPHHNMEANIHIENA